MKAYSIFKRMIDIIIALFWLIIFMPLFLIITILIKFSSRGPVIYKHKRVGKSLKPFTIYKFRTMVDGARELQEKGVPTDKLITTVGKFLRKSFLDETLQLINLLKGDISLVGPRPKDVEAFEKLVKRDERWNEVISIKPGITSLESVADYMSLKKRKDFEKHFKGLLKEDKSIKFREHTLMLDLYYIKNKSFFFDLKIIFFTLFLMLKRIFFKEKSEWKEKMNS